jgi:hypothetical protein
MKKRGGFFDSFHEKSEFITDFAPVWESAVRIKILRRSG